jgi:hypothetical protein
VRWKARAKKNTRKQLSLRCHRYCDPAAITFPLFFCQIKAHHYRQARCKNGAKPHSCNTRGPPLHHMRTDSMAQNTYLKKENKFSLLAEKMKIYLHKLKQMLTGDGQCNTPQSQHGNAKARLPPA